MSLSEIEGGVARSSGEDGEEEGREGCGGGGGGGGRGAGGGGGQVGHVNPNLRPPQAQALVYYGRS